MAGAQHALYNVKVNYLETMRAAGDCHKVTNNTNQNRMCQNSVQFKDIVKTSSEKEIISILVSDTGAHIVRARGKMKTTFHLRNRIEVSRN